MTSTGRTEVRLMVMGTPRSGTTLTQRIVTEESGLPSAPESHFFTLLPVIVRRVGDLPTALREYAAAPQLRGCELDVEALIEAAGGEGMYSLFRAVIWQLTGGASAAFEKTPDHLWWWRRLTDRDPALKLVVVVRDPRAVVASLRTAKFTAHGTAVLAETWRVDAAMASAARRTLGPERCLLVRYEDLVGSESAVRGQIAEFCRPISLRPAETGGSLAGGPMVLAWEAWKRGYEQPVHGARATAWRDELDGSDVRRIERACGGGMADYDYPRSATRGGPAELLTHLRDAPRRWRYRLAVSGHVRRQRGFAL